MPPVPARLAVLACAAVLAGACASSSPVPEPSVTPSAGATATATTTATAEPTPTGSPTAAPSATATPTGAATDTATTVDAYQVALVLPDGWSRTEDNPARFTGPDGYVELDALANADSAHAGCEQLAHHALQPYGSDPAIEDRSVDGQDACVLRPSDDQPSEMHGEAAAVVMYPTPVTIDGDSPGEPSQTYDALVVYADGPHLDALVDTLRFTGTG